MGDDERQSWSQRAVPELIRRRFTTKFMTVVVVAMVIGAGVGGIFFFQINSTLEQQVDEDVTETANLRAETLVNWVDGIESQTQTLARSTTFQADTPADVQAALDQQSFRDDIRAVHVLDTESTEIQATTGVSDLRGVPFESLDVPWVSQLDSISQDVQGESQVFISDTPYTSVTGDDAIAFITSPPDRPDRLVVVEAAVTAERFGYSSDTDGYLTIHDPETDVGEFVYDGSPDDKVVSSSLSELEGSDAVADEVIRQASVEGTDWTVVAHVSQSEAFSLRNQVGASLGALVVVPLLVIGIAVAVTGRQTGRTLEDLTERAEQMRNGNLDVSFETTRVDEIGRLAMAFEDVRKSLKQRINEAERAREEAEVSRAEAVELSKYLQTTADEYAQIMQRCGAGDLTQRMEADGENDAMDQIATEFNEMIEELEKTVGQLKSFSDEVETAGEEVEESAETVRDASEQVAQSIQRISDDAYDQQEQLKDAAETVDSVVSELESHTGDELQEPLEQFDEITTLLDDLVEISEETMAESENVAGAAEEQAAELNEVSDRANDLTRYAGPLRDVLERFETQDEREFFFPSGPGTGDQSRS